VLIVDLEEQLNYVLLLGEPESPLLMAISLSIDNFFN